MEYFQANMCRIFCYIILVTLGAGTHGINGTAEKVMPENVKEFYKKYMPPLSTAWQPQQPEEAPKWWDSESVPTSPKIIYDNAPSTYVYPSYGAYPDATKYWLKPLDIEEHIEPYVHSLPEKFGHWLTGKAHIDVSVMSVLKMLLKLIVVKKIVKFFLILGILLFLPHFRNLHGWKTAIRNHPIFQAKDGIHPTYHHYHVHDFRLKNKIKRKKEKFHKIINAIAAKENVGEARAAPGGHLMTFLKDAVNAFTSVPPTCTGSEDFSCRLTQMFELIDHVYGARK